MLVECRSQLRENPALEIHAFGNGFYRNVGPHARLHGTVILHALHRIGGARARRVFGDARSRAIHCPAIRLHKVDFASGRSGYEGNTRAHGAAADNHYLHRRLSLRGRSAGTRLQRCERAAAMDEPGWQVAASSYVLESPYLRIRSDRIVLPDGTVIEDYYVRESRGYVIVFALTADRSVVLVRQYKHGAGKVLLELIAGAIDEGEEPQQSAARELAEETGYAAESIEHVASFVTDPTNADTVAHLFFARGAYRSGEQQLDPTENITVELAALEELRNKIQSGEIDSLPHVGAIYYILDRFTERSPD